MNLNTHILLGIAIGIGLFHNLDIAILIAIGAAIPDLDREYLFTKSEFSTKHQLHRALLHNLFFSTSLLFFNQFLALGVFLHIILDMITSPTDRGVEIFFPLTRLVKGYDVDYEGNRSGTTKKIKWYLEDPYSLIRRSSDPDLKELKRVPWRRIYGPFRNGRVIDWFISYSCIIYIILYTHYNFGSFLSWLTLFILHLIKDYSFITIGLIAFYGIGEAWRRKLQKIDVNRKLILILAIISLILILIQANSMYYPLHFDFRSLLLPLISSILGFTLSLIHQYLRRKEFIL